MAIVLSVVSMRLCVVWVGRPMESKESQNATLCGAQMLFTSTINELSWYPYNLTNDTEKTEKYYMNTQIALEAHNTTLMFGRISSALTKPKYKCNQKKMAIVEHINFLLTPFDVALTSFILMTCYWVLSTRDTCGGSIRACIPAQISRRLLLFL